MHDEQPLQLDLDALVEQVGLDREDILELLGMLVGQADLQLSQIRDGLADGGDPATAQRAAHSLKGMASTLGLDALAATARQIEAAIRAGQPTEAASHVDELQARIVVARRAFDEIRPADDPSG